MINFNLKGVDEALRKLEMIDEAVSDRSLRADALEILEPIAEDARSLAPVDEGDLRDSIQTTVFEDGSVGVIIRDWKGHFFEFGTVNMRAQPMLLPAWDKHEESLGNAFGDLVKARIEYSFRDNRVRPAIRVTGL